MYINTLNNNIISIQCLQKDLGLKLNKALTLGISDKDCLEKDNYLITAILRVLYNASGSTFPVTSYSVSVTGLITLTYTDGWGVVQTVQVGTAPKPELSIFGTPYAFCIKEGTAITVSDVDLATVSLSTDGCPLDENNCLTDDELCSLIEMAYTLLNVNCC